MVVNIWSDIRCPFCYIGKEKFEQALNSFSKKDQIKVNWRSFELDPELVTDPEMSSIEYFSRVKGIPEEQAEGMMEQVKHAAKSVDLTFDFKNSVVANSFNGHRLIHLAQSKAKAGEAEEALFKAQFTEGKNIDDPETLLETGVSIGLDKREVEELLSSTKFSDDVRRDEEQAQAFGIHGVPFFVFNDKYAVSGAQSPEVFLQSLQQAWNDFEKQKQTFIITEGESCKSDGCN